ncbi:MAG: GNAT family N-acetyltransferase [Fimbriimonas sp.]
MLERIRDSQIRAASANRLTKQIGPFVAMLSLHDDLPWINYAVPNGGVSDEFLGPLEAFFREHKRRPRFEFFPDLAPELEGLLLARGYTKQGQLPLMVCDASSFQPVTGVPVEVLSASDDLTILGGTVRRAFGSEEPPNEEEIATTREGLESGRMRAALARVDGVPAGGAYTVGDAMICELAGVGTLPEFRRRGVASSASSALMQEHFRNPDTLVWLSAGDDVAKAVYERLGFKVIGTQLNYIQDN